MFRALHILLLVWLMIGCDRSPTLPEAQPGEPDIRVRTHRNQAGVTVAAREAMHVIPLGAADTTHDQPVTIARTTAGWTVNGQPLAVSPDTAIVISSPDFPLLSIGSKQYPGKLYLHPLETGSFDIVNVLPIDAYLPGVIKKELPDRWNLTTHYAQAIAARTYAIHKLLQTPPGRHYDINADQSAQVYEGFTSHDKSLVAVLETAGLVLSSEDAVFPAYYASNSGGQGLSPDDAFGETPFAAPLMPRFRPDYTADTKFGRWGPIERPLSDLAGRLQAWGKRRDHPIKRLTGIRNITITRHNAVGRAARFTITDLNGKTYTLPADSFRVAANTKTSVPLKSGQRLLSANCRVTVAGTVARFYDGRGLGHGVGLCQHGAQQMAEQGSDVFEILETYYPGAKIERAY